MENSYKGHDIEMMFTKIIGKLERIEEKLDETSYPPEETLKPDFVERIKTAEKEILKGSCVAFDSMDDFLKSVEK
ncbi:MAG TPA: hypothetical protein HA257_05590 [Candidatus Methanoperedenaceae archaeon]|nr:hypothetical protein [Candidatus Methanoperedenaceae archaeon]